MSAELEFRKAFVVQFLAAYAATHYDGACATGQQEKLERLPVEDAEFLAEKAWEKQKDQAPTLCGIEVKVDASLPPGTAFLMPGTSLRDMVKLVDEVTNRSLESDSEACSCNCLTKSPELQYHKPGCKYRLTRERNEARECCDAVQKNRDLVLGQLAEALDALQFYAGRFPNDDLANWEERMVEDEGDKARAICEKHGRVTDGSDKEE